MRLHARVSYAVWVLAAGSPPMRARSAPFRSAEQPISVREAFERFPLAQNKTACTVRAYFPRGSCAVLPQRSPVSVRVRPSVSGTELLGVTFSVPVMGFHDHFA
jgi:hypothetical protein